MPINQSFAKTVPTLKTNRLILAGIQSNDVEAYRKHFVDYEVIRHLSSLVPWPYPEKGVEDFFNNILLSKQGIDRWTWAIRIKESPEEIIGCVDLWRPAFSNLGFEEVTLANAVGNSRSRRIKEKTAATFVELRTGSFVDPNYKSMETWKLTRQEWLEFRGV